MLTTPLDTKPLRLGRRDAITAVRFAFVNAFSFFKRFFYFDSALYSALTILPLLAIATPSLSRRGIVLAVAFAGYYAALGAHTFPLYFLTFCALQICLPVFQRASFEDILARSAPLFWIAALYGAWQKLYGYSPIELRWIESGLGIVGAENYFLTEEIRPFSVFAGIPEFGFFVVCYLYYFYRRGQAISTLCAALLLFLIGSRGLLLATGVAIVASALHGSRLSVRAAGLLGLAISMSAYVALAILLPFLTGVEEGSTRLLLQGTFQARILAASEFLQSVTLSNLWFGVGHRFSAGLIPDNLYINFLNDVGLLGLAAFVALLFSDCRNERQLFFLVVILSYGFYAGVIYSFYFMFNFFLAFYAARPRPECGIDFAGAR